MAMCFETDVFVDTEAYDTGRIPVVNNFFLTLFWLRVVARMPCCAAGEDSDATLDAALFREPENFTRTDLATESSYGVSAGGASVKARLLLRHSRTNHGTVSCLKPSIIQRTLGSECSAIR